MDMPLLSKSPHDENHRLESRNKVRAGGCEEMYGFFLLDTPGEEMINIIIE